jgi:hypothetical protein
MHNRKAFPAGHRHLIHRRDAFHLGPVSGLFVARIAEDHAIVVESVQIAFSAFVAGHLKLV